MSQLCLFVISFLNYDRLHEKQGIPKNFLPWEQKLSLYLTTFEAVKKNALWLDNRGRKMLKTQATAIPKYGNIIARLVSDSPSGNAHNHEVK